MVILWTHHLKLSYNPVSCILPQLKENCTAVNVGNVTDRSLETRQHTPPSMLNQKHFGMLRWSERRNGD